MCLQFYCLAAVAERPFLEWFALCYFGVRTVVGLSWLSVLSRPVGDVGVGLMWPNCRMDENAKLYEDRP